MYACAAPEGRHTRGARSRPSRARSSARAPLLRALQFASSAILKKVMASSMGPPMSVGDRVLVDGMAGEIAFLGVSLRAPAGVRAPRTASAADAPSLANPPPQETTWRTCQRGDGWAWCTTSLWARMTAPSRACASSSVSVAVAVSALYLA